MTNTTNINRPDAEVPPALPQFATILCDPPTAIAQTGSLGAINHYDLMSMARLRTLPVNKLAQPNAHLWLWTTNAAIEDSYQLARDWGFTPRSLFTWVKPRYGLGNYLRNATEQLIFATKGRAPVRYKSQPTWGYMPLQEHSHKPEEQFAIIERVSPGPYLELFARRRPPSDKDWSVWGNEVDSDIDLSAYGFPVPSDDKTPVAGEEVVNGRS